MFMPANITIKNEGRKIKSQMGLNRQKQLGS